jgi:hypothetical protein
MYFPSGSKVSNASIVFSYLLKHRRLALFSAAPVHSGRLHQKYDTSTHHKPSKARKGAGPKCKDALVPENFVSTSKAILVAFPGLNGLHPRMINLALVHINLLTSTAVYLVFTVSSGWVTYLETSQQSPCIRETGPFHSWHTQLSVRPRLRWRRCSQLPTFRLELHTLAPTVAGLCNFQILWRSLLLVAQSSVRSPERIRGLPFLGKLVHCRGGSRAFVVLPIFGHRF